ncbi:MAG: 2Fe-2S iron-sulfur cluster-binding protein [Burkholderiaceae bacterium]
MSDAIEFTVNGRPVSAPAEQDNVSLLNFVRDTLGLARSRFGCGSGTCGACTVIVNGRAVTACDLSLAGVAGADVQTAESLGQDETAHPVLQALLAQQAAQCGYCVSGIAVRVKALLDEHPRPSRAELHAALDQHLCRCGAQSRMLRALEPWLATEGAES